MMYGRFLLALYAVIDLEKKLWYVGGVVGARSVVNSEVGLMLIWSPSHCSYVTLPLHFTRPILHLFQLEQVPEQGP